MKFATENFIRSIQLIYSLCKKTSFFSLRLLQNWSFTQVNSQFFSCASLKNEAFFIRDRVFLRALYRKGLKKIRSLTWVAKFTVFLSLIIVSSCNKTKKPNSDDLLFMQGENGSYYFDTGIIKGSLRDGGKTIGLVPVVNSSDSTEMARREGIYNHYRVFTYGKRYGKDARGWPSTAEIISNGSVMVTWPATSDRPFEMQAKYKLVSRNTIDLLTIVKAKTKLESFEVFLASYFDTGFTVSKVYINDSTTKKAKFVSAERELGYWLAFPRDSIAETLILDGRWDIEPHPLTWTIMADYEQPLAYRKDTLTNLTVVMMTKEVDCFGIYTPFGEERHYSTYFSLFGNTIEKDSIATAHSRLVFLNDPSEKEILKQAKAFLK